MLSYLSHNRNISEKGSGDKVKIGGGNQPMERKDDSVSVSGTTSEPDKISDLGQKQSVESNTPEAETAGTGEKRPLEIRYQHHNLRSRLKKQKKEAQPEENTISSSPSVGRKEQGANVVHIPILCFHAVTGKEVQCTLLCTF